jgi:hypothetical protein
VTLALLKLVYKCCVGHAGAEVLVLQVAPSVFVIVTHLAFEAIVTHAISTVTVAVVGRPGASECARSQPARVEVQDARLNGKYFVGRWAGTTIAGSIAGQPTRDRVGYQLHPLRLCAWSYGWAAIRYGRAGYRKARRRWGAVIC